MFAFFPRPERRTSETTRPRRTRDERGVVFPSPVVILSIVATAMAAVAFVATMGDDTPTERDVTPVAQESTPAATEAPETPADTPTQTPTNKPSKPAVDRSSVYVVVFNNSGVTGLAGSVADQVGDAGWQVVGADNWYGTIPNTTVYYPPRLERAAKLLAQDMGVQRLMPAVDPMRSDRLTLILTGPLG